VTTLGAPFSTTVWVTTVGGPAATAPGIWGWDVAGAAPTIGAEAEAFAASVLVVTTSPTDASTTAHAAPANSNAGRWYHGSAGSVASSDSSGSYTSSGLAHSGSAQSESSTGSSTTDS
jgi:hypothetical protein